MNTVCNLFSILLLPFAVQAIPAAAPAAEPTLPTPPKITGLFLYRSSIWVGKQNDYYLHDYKGLSEDGKYDDDIINGHNLPDKVWKDNKSIWLVDYEKDSKATGYRVMQGITKMYSNHTGPDSPLRGNAHSNGVINTKGEKTEDVTKQFVPIWLGEDKYVIGSAKQDDSGKVTAAYCLNNLPGESMTYIPIPSSYFAGLGTKGDWAPIIADKGVACGVYLAGYRKTAKK